jgi:hypothetical protein
VAQGLKRGISVTCVSNIRKTAKTFGKRHLLVGDLGKWAKSNSLFFVIEPNTESIGKLFCL